MYVCVRLQLPVSVYCMYIHKWFAFTFMQILIFPYHVFYVVPNICPGGYYGAECLNKCNCNNNAACDKNTGYCSGSGGVCATGLICVISME